MSDISNLLIKDSYDYVIQVDPVTKQVLRIGGSVPTNPIFLSGLTVYSSFKFSNGTENNGYVLTCDAQGNAYWAPVSGTSVCLPTIKSGKIDKNLFSGQPYTYKIVFNNPILGEYGISVIGKDVRVWSIDDDSISGFTINTNSNVPLSDYVFWQVTENFTCTGGTGTSGTSGASGAPTYKTLLISTSTANITFDYFYYGVNYDGAVDLYLPSCSGLDGRLITIKDELGNCNQVGKRIRLNPYSGETIDNNNFVDMAISKMSLQLITRGNNWFII